MNNTAHKLFLLLQAIAKNYSIDIPTDEAAFVSMLYNFTQKHRFLTELYKDTLLATSTECIENYIPLFARMIQNTIGLVDSNNDIIYIPHQWFVVGNKDEDYPEIIKRHTNTAPHTYSIDFDEDYTARYIEHATTNQWTTTTDQTQLKWKKDHRHDSSSSISSTIPSAEEIENAVASKLDMLKLHTNYEHSFSSTWGDVFSFDGKSATTFNIFPSPLHPHFHQELYKTTTFAFTRQMIENANITPNNNNPSKTFTFKEHQQYVRNFMSPITPYQSLLVVHSTGSGKTFTTFGITEQFRDLAYIQNKKIHITCPKIEICDEFSNYFKHNYESNTPQNYVMNEYHKEQSFSQPFTDEKKTQQYASHHYNIQTYYSIFPKSYYSYIYTLQQIFCAWQVAVPSLSYIHRTDSGFCFEIPHTINASQLNIVLTSLQIISTKYEKELGELWGYTFTKSKTNVIVNVSNTLKLAQFEKHLTDTYANTVFVVDEAHRINKEEFATPMQNIIKQNTTGTVSAQNINWTFILYFIIGVLRYHHLRMRLLLLTATPMQNESQDLVRLLNLMIHNDGYKQENLHRIYNNKKITNRSESDVQHLATSIAARVSYFKDDRGKPVKLNVEDILYNLPRSSLYQTEPVYGEVCPVLWVSDIKAFLASTKELETPSMVWNQTKANTRSHHIPLDEIRRTGQCNDLHYVYIVLHSSLAKARREAWLALCGEHLTINHTVVLVSASKEYAEACSNDTALHVLFKHTSVRHPLSFTTPHVHSIYTTSIQPRIYAPSLSNMNVFFANYLGQTVVSNTPQHKNTPSVVATSMQNRAFTTSDVKKSLRYQFSGQRINNWNKHDTTDRIYQPKIDTMMSLMEKLPGNILIYTNEVQLGKEGARSLQFLKRLIETRFHNNKHSRLSNVVVEILHKETLTYSDESDFANALNQRIREINNKLLAKRNDVVLIGSIEIREGLTMNEIRQVHLLDVCWNIAQMQQIYGRAIRINNHQKHATKALHNVSCFLHVSIPESVSDESSEETLPMVSRMSYMERMIGDLHRFKCMYNKIDDIVMATKLLQNNAIDIIYLNVSASKQQCILADTEKPSEHHGGWKIVKHKYPSISLLQTIHKKKVSFSSITTTNHHTQDVIKGSKRKDIDVLKNEVCRMFRMSHTPFKTYNEIVREIQKNGAFGDPCSFTTSFSLQLHVDYWASLLHLQDYTTAQNVLQYSEGLSSTDKNALLLTILCCQYKWFIREKTEDYYVLAVDPLSIVENTDWLWSSATKRPNANNVSLMNIRKHTATDAKQVLQQLSQTYIVPIQTTTATTPNTKKHVLLRGAQLQHILYDALDNALYELIQDNTPIEYAERCFYRLVHNEPFYTLQRLNIPATQALWNVNTDGTNRVNNTLLLQQTPYSTQITHNVKLNIEILTEIIQEMNNVYHTLLNRLTPYSLLSESILTQYVVEYIFDNLTLTLQDTLLRNICVHGFYGIKEICKLTDEHLTCLTLAVYHRYCEKGKKAIEVEPERAQTLLKTYFVNCVGRMYCSFPHNPATEHCAIHAYSSSHSSGKASTVKYQSFICSSHNKTDIYTEAVKYFSPVPIHKSNEGGQFYASKRIHTASTPPLGSATSLFGYNEVLNYKNREAAYLQSFLCTHDNYIGYDLLSAEALTYLSSVAYKDDLHPVFKDTLSTTEQQLNESIENIESIHIRIQTTRLCRFILLRHNKLYMRYFYAGIVTKHPNGEYYANYKHTLKKKIL